MPHLIAPMPVTLPAKKMQNIYLLINILGFLLTMYVAKFRCKRPSPKKIVRMQGWRLSDGANRDEHVRPATSKVFMSCDLPTVLLRATG